MELLVYSSLNVEKPEYNTCFKCPNLFLTIGIYVRIQQSQLRICYLSDPKI